MATTRLHRNGFAKYIGGLVGCRSVLDHTLTRGSWPKAHTLHAFLNANSEVFFLLVVGDSHRLCKRILLDMVRSARIIWKQKQSKSRRQNGKIRNISNQWRNNFVRDVHENFCKPMVGVVGCVHLALCRTVFAHPFSVVIAQCFGRRTRVSLIILMGIFWWTARIRWFTTSSYIWMCVRCAHTHT